MAAGALLGASVGLSLLDLAINTFALEDQRAQARADVSFRQKEIEHAVALERSNAEVRARKRNAELQLTIGNADAAFASAGITGGTTATLMRAGAAATAGQNQAMDRARVQEFIRTAKIQKRFLDEKLARAETNISLREISSLMRFGRATGTDVTAYLEGLPPPETESGKTLDELIESVQWLRKD